MSAYLRAQSYKPLRGQFPQPWGLDSREAAHVGLRCVYEFRVDDPPKTQRAILMQKVYYTIRVVRLQ